MTGQNPYPLVDVHAHICDADFDGDRSAILAKAASAGIGAIVAVGENLEDAERNLQLAEQYPMLKPAAGLYPTHLDLDRAAEMVDFIRQNKDRLVAIGEVGLDYWVIKEASDKARQREIFKTFIALSNQLGLPLNIHSRSAGHHAINMLLENSARQAHLHAFDGKASRALPAVEAGYFFSIPPSVIRSRQKQKLVKQLPLTCLLVESDSPVLGPDPQKRNEPANLTVAISSIAKIKAVAPEAVREATSANAIQLYGSLSLQPPDGALE